LATVRIYKVAELLNTSSQEVLALLKRAHGIELKSASSTIEEVVARQFVERLARERGITLPGGDMFAEGPASKPGAKKPAAGAKKVEPAKPAVTLAPPRLVKTVKPAAPAGTSPTAEEPVQEEVPPPSPVEEPAEVPAPIAEAPAPPVAAVPAEKPEPVPVVEEPAPEPAPAPPAVEPPAAAAKPVAARPAVAPTPPPAPSSRPTVPTGRIVPPSIRLRIEEPNAPGTSAVPAMPTRPAASRLRPSDKVVPPRPTAPLPPATGNLARPGGPGGGPGGISTRPAPQRPSYPPMRPSVPPGGPRPLPTVPIRPPQPQGMRPSGGVGQQRPGAPRFTPPPMRPTAGRRPDGDRRDQRPQQQAQMPPPPVTRTITFVEGMTVKDLADKLDQRVKDVLKKLLDKRLMMTINSTVDTDTASMIAREFGAELQLRTFEQDMLEVEAEDVKPEDTITRAPVVTVMGHVDHGKTTLLDAIRTTRVAEREAGGITQHIGAYHVTTETGRDIVFLDTPGHEAFTLMRARGAKVTDVVVLVVAADDGVMPQTREAIDHAKAANVPIIVAINKIDKPGADPERVKRELSDLNLVPEDWGGQTVMVPVSAKKKTGLDTLLEMVLLVSDIGEYKANPKRNASGTVLESKLDRGRGPVATILVQDGTLRVGDTFIAGPIVGRVRALIDDRGKPIKMAPPSTPVEVLGLTGLPQPGDAFQALADAAKARQIATYRQGMAKEKALGAKGSRLTLESLQQQIAEGGMKDLPIVIKSDVQGSAEVLADTLSKLSDDRVRIKIIHSGVGAINESDVLLASASNAIIIGFNVRPDRNAESLAEREEVDIRHHTVIYNVTDEMKKAMTGLLEPTLKEVRLGAAEVRNIFKVPKAGTIAGCYVIEGRITRSGDTKARLMRDGVMVHEGKIGSLRRFKDDVSEVKTGFECGIAFDKFNDIKIGDIIEVFTIERVAVSA
jgi:translation initiation factor IF-2